MIVFPNSKINLGLRVIRKRKDNYHNIETVFYPLNLCDILEIIPLTKPPPEPGIPFSKSGFGIEGKIDNNLCLKAYRILKNDFPKLPAVQIHLHKGVPAGAGLGGGSADAAFTLKLLNEEFGLGLSKSLLIDYAVQLGSDCAFFIINTPCYATSKGEQLEPIGLDLSAYKFVIVNPGIRIDTGQAFLYVSPSRPERTIKEILAEPLERWKDELYNDFELPAFKKYPEIVEIKDRLYIAGAIFASMSGSGSTVFGIFPKTKPISLSFPSNYFVHESAG